MNELEREAYEVAIDEQRRHLIEELERKYSDDDYLHILFVDDSDPQQTKYILLDTVRTDEIESIDDPHRYIVDQIEFRSDIRLGEWLDQNNTSVADGYKPPADLCDDYGSDIVAHTI